MNSHLIPLFSGIHVPYDRVDNSVEDDFVFALNSEIATYGYTFDSSVINRLKSLSKNDFRAFRTDIISDLSTISGSSMNHATLFKDFPYSVPEQRSYLIRRVISYIQNITGQASNHLMLSCGHYIDQTLFNLNTFGACPMCQHQVDELDSEDVAVHPYVSSTPLKILTLLREKQISRKANAILARQSSIKPAERAFIEAMRNIIAIDLPDKAFKENLPIIYDLTRSYSYSGAYVATQLSGATDVLRIATYVSDTQADLSLSDNTKFDLTKSHKKNILAFIEFLASKNRASCIEDMLRHRERWLRLGELLYPGTAANRKRYPKTANIFDKLRNSSEKISSFSRTVEKKMRAKVVDDELLKTLASRPAEMMRRLDFLLRTTTEPSKVMPYLGSVSSVVSTKMLLEMTKYLENRADSPDQRVFVPKGTSNRIKILDDKRPKIADAVLLEAINVIDNSLIERFSKKEPMGRVYIDPDLKGIILPFNQRGDSETSTAILKGSRYPFGNSPVIRLFAHWIGNGIDVDLSMVLLDKDYKVKEQISFTNLSSHSIVHSGDIQSAPHGASEFIDFEISDAIDDGYRYAVMSVISYRGHKFNTFPCFAGFMERDALRSGKKYQPEAVALKFDIKQATTANMPLIFDLESREIIYADLSGGDESGRAVQSSGSALATLAKGVIELHKRKPTVYDIISLHAQARGEIVDDVTNADIQFTAQDLDIDKLIMEMVD